MALAAGDILTAASLGATVTSQQPVSGTTTSTTYTATLTGGTACGVTFTAPASGKVSISNTVEALNSGATFSGSSIRVGTGTTIGAGTVVLAVNDDNIVLNTGTSAVTVTRTTLLTGLVSGSAYNVQQQFRIGGGTGTFARKELIVRPEF